MTSERMNEIRDLLAKATKGPWRLEDCRAKRAGGSCWCAVISAVQAYDQGIANAGCLTRENAALIVAAINAIPELLDAVEERDLLRAGIPSYDALKSRAEQAESNEDAWRAHAFRLAGIMNERTNCDRDDCSHVACIAVRETEDMARDSIARTKPGSQG